MMRCRMVPALLFLVLCAGAGCSTVRVRLTVSVEPPREGVDVTVYYESGSGADQSWQGRTDAEGECRVEFEPKPSPLGAHFSAHARASEKLEDGRHRWWKGRFFSYEKDGQLHLSSAKVRKRKVDGEDVLYITAVFDASEGKWTPEPIHRFDLEVTSSPSGAEIWIGSTTDVEATKWRTPDTVIWSKRVRRPDDRAGFEGQKRYVQLRKEGWQDTEVREVVIDLARKAMHFDLERELITLTERITSDPPGARILWGPSPGALRETGRRTPYSRRNRGVNPGFKDFYFQVRKKGYKDSKVVFRKAERRDRTVHFELERQTYGYLKLTSNEEDVSVYMDGERVGRIRNKLLNLKVPVGRHQITAKKKFFMPNAIVVDMGENEVFEYAFELVRSKGWKEDRPGTGRIVQAKGTLVLVTEREDLVVFIEGIRRIPPIELKDIAAGIYGIRVTGPGIDKSFQVTIEHGDKEVVDLDELTAK